MSRRRTIDSDGSANGSGNGPAPDPSPHVIVDRDVDQHPIEWVELTARRADLDVPENRQLSQRAIVLGIVAVASLMLLALFSSAGEPIGAPSSERDSDESMEADSRTESTPTTTSSGSDRVTEKLVVTTAPDEWLEDYVLAWATSTDSMQVANALDGTEIETQRWSTLVWPISPDASFFGTRNNSWVVDPTDISQSGQLANTAQLVRLGPKLDRYAFVTSAAEKTEFYVGSLWGAAGTGLTDAPVSSAILAVPDRGVVIANVDGTSRVIDKDGVRDLPSRLGRVVTASRSHIVGSFCDDLARCIGRIQDWDGGNERQVDAGLVTAPSVHLSPDGSILSSSDSTSWTITTFDPGGRPVVQTTRISPTTDAVWSSDGQALLWLEGSEVRIARPGLDDFAVHSIGWTVESDDLGFDDAQLMLIRVSE